MRGRANLKQEGPAANQTSSGLDRDYITNWSYGIGGNTDSISAQR